MIQDTVLFGEADLSNCDREPIHTPESIQPHGVLLVVDRRTLSIEQVAGDTAFLLGLAPERLIGLQASSLFDELTHAYMSSQFAATSERIAPLLRLGVMPRSGSLALDLTLSALGQTALIELEAARRTLHSSGDPMALLKLLLSSLEQGRQVDDCCEAATQTLRRVTEFDRSMVYRFQPDDSGVVIAEDRRPDLEPFLGLHYPASDIPAQARELYLRNWLRCIPNAHYAPAPLQPVSRRTGGPVDLSYCGLRSVSPIHLEYLRNMGVSATLVMSIICHGRLWGMLVLHHDSPRYVAADLRVACEAFAQILSLQIEAKTLIEQGAARIAARGIREALVAQLMTSTNIGETLATRDLLRYVHANGVAVSVDGRLHTFGFCPRIPDIERMVQWLNGIAKPLLATDELSSLYPPASGFAELVSGLLAVSLTRDTRDYVLWFRAEYETTVRWAGDPAKPVKIEKFGSRLTPRGSFEEWRQQVRMRSVPWSEVDIEAAEALRVVLLEHVLKAMDDARRARESAFHRQNLLLAELDHRVRNALGKIDALISRARVGTNSVQGFATTLQQRIQAMLQTHILLSEGRWIGTSLRRLLEGDFASLASAQRERIELSGDDVFLSPLEALALSVVFYELISNALEHGALSVDRGKVAVTWRLDAASRLLSITWSETDGPLPPSPLVAGAGMEGVKHTIVEELHGSVDFETAGGLRCRIELPAGDLALR